MTNQNDSLSIYTGNLFNNPDVFLIFSKSKSLLDFHEKLDASDIKIPTGLTKNIIKTFSVDELCSYVNKFYKFSFDYKSIDIKEKMSLFFVNSICEYRKSNPDSEHYCNNALSKFLIEPEDFNKFIKSEAFQQSSMQLLRNFFSVQNKSFSQRYASDLINKRNKIIKIELFGLLDKNFDDLVSIFKKQNKLVDFFNFFSQNKTFSHYPKIKNFSEYIVLPEKNIISEINLLFSTTKLSEAEKSIYYLNNYPKDNLKQILTENNFSTNKEINIHSLPFFIKNDLVKVLNIKNLHFIFNKLSSTKKISLISDLKNSPEQKEFVYSLIFNDNIGNSNIDFISLYKKDDLTKSKYYKPEKLRLYVETYLSEYDSAALKDPKNIDILKVLFDEVKTTNIFTDEYLNKKIVSFFISKNRYTSEKFKEKLVDYNSFLNNFGLDIISLKFKDYIKNTESLRDGAFKSYIENKILLEETSNNQIDISHSNKTNKKRL